MPNIAGHTSNDPRTLLDACAFDGGHGRAGRSLLVLPALPVGLLRYVRSGRDLVATEERTIWMRDCLLTLLTLSSPTRSRVSFEAAPSPVGSHICVWKVCCISTLKSRSVASGIGPTHSTHTV